MGDGCIIQQMALEQLGGHQEEEKGRRGEKEDRRGKERREKEKKMGDFNFFYFRLRKNFPKMIKTMKP